MNYFHAIIVSFLFLEVTSKVIPLQPKIKTNRSVVGAGSNGTLIFAHVIYRHGERNTDAPKDLTNEGKREMFALGEYFQRRYSEILGDTYSPKTVYTLSTDHDRAIQSAQSNLAGLFPPRTADEIWNDKLLWQPVPVHIILEEADYLLHLDKPCPKHDLLLENIFKNSKVVQDIFKKYGHLFPFWAEMSGQNVTTIAHVGHLYKKLLTDKEQNKPLPDWAKEAIEPNGPMEYIAKVNYKLRGIPELARFKSGFLIREIMDRFSKKLKATLKPDRSLWLYSGHSTTITYMLNGLGFSELEIPPHACSLHFELFRINDDEHYLQFYYRKPDEEYPSPLSLPKLGEKWTLDQFYTVNKKIIPGDFDSECRVD